jgi:hypothetical protein
MNTKQKPEKTEKLLVKMSAEDKKLILDYANANSINLSALVRRLLLDHVTGKKKTT